MTGFQYRGGILHADDVPLPAIAASFGTPTYVYSAGTIRKNYQALDQALSPIGVRIAYALKANSNQAVIATLARLGAGADVVSGGELQRALAAGIPADRIVFSGVGKTAEEMELALRAGIHQLNVESFPELALLNEVAERVGIRAPIALRINPDVDAGTHAKITTGRRENKFGIDLDEAVKSFHYAKAMPHLDVLGVAVHIGSQLLDLAPYRAAYKRLATLVHVLGLEGIPLKRIDLGGGLGIGYRGETPPDPVAFARIIQEEVGHLGMELTIEPGRSLVGDAGCLLTRCVYAKLSPSKRFLILDAGMNDLLRPALYDAHHAIVPVVEAPPEQGASEADVVGPVCETGDTFATARMMPSVMQDDLLAILHAGAYGSVMSSTYNTRPLATEILVDGSRHAVIRPRQTFEELLAMEILPDWLR